MKTTAKAKAKSKATAKATSKSQQYENVSAADHLKLAKKHLKQAEAAWDPPEWEDLSVYGFYCLEAAIDAAARHLKMKTPTEHWEKAKTAEKLHAKYNMPEVAGLLLELNDTRKAVAYGYVEPPDLEAEQVVTDLAEFVGAVQKLLSGKVTK